MYTVACVLRTGAWLESKPREYGPEHVQWLKRMVAQHLSLDHRFVCLSNVDVPGVEVVPLTQDWPGWWSKLELFGHDFGPTVYMDLDTVIVKPLDDMVAHPHTFTALAQLSSNQKGCMNSSLMAWTGKRPEIYEAFRADPDRHIAECVKPGNWGDQGFTNRHVGRWDAWQTLFPGSVASYKRDWKRGGAKAARVICFNGLPKPWNLEADWIPPLG